MTNLTDFKNHPVFDCVFKAPRVNTLHDLVVDFDVVDDTKLCSHCFYDSKKTTFLNGINKAKNRTRTKTPSKQHSKIKNKNKTNRR